jgi:hypothetical protein
MDGIDNLAISVRHRSGRGLLRVGCGAVRRKAEPDYIISFTTNWLGIADSVSLLLRNNFPVLPGIGADAACDERFSLGGQLCFCDCGIYSCIQSTECFRTPADQRRQWGQKPFVSALESLCYNDFRGEQHVHNHNQRP